MDNKPRTGRAKAVGLGIVRVLFPFHAIRRTAHLAKQEARRTQENVVMLRDMADHARRSLVDSKEKQTDSDVSTFTDDSFDAVMARRKPGSLSIPQLRHSFLLKKRAALAMATFFLVTAAIQIGWGIAISSPRLIFLGSLCLISSQPLCFVIALGAHFRIWQLDNRRLSRAEKGGLNDFKSEVPHWWLAVLDPEFRRID